MPKVFDYLQRLGPLPLALLALGGILHWDDFPCCLRTYVIVTELSGKLLRIGSAFVASCAREASIRLGHGQVHVPVETS